MGLPSLWYCQKQGDKNLQQKWHEVNPHLSLTKVTILGYNIHNKQRNSSDPLTLFGKPEMSQQLGSKSTIIFITFSSVIVGIILCWENPSTFWLMGAPDDTSPWMLSIAQGDAGGDGGGRFWLKSSMLVKQWCRKSEPVSKCELQTKWDQSSRQQMHEIHSHAYL